MIRWKGYYSWILVWGATFILGGLILYEGYLAASSNQPDRAVLALQTQEGMLKKADPILQVPANKQTTEDDEQINIPKSSNGDQAILGEHHSGTIQENKGAIELSIKDFPSPVQGKLLRGIGNHYSEAFRDYIFHAGNDYAEPEGTIIRATHEGKVIFAGPDPILGQKVTLDSGNGWLVTYGSLDNLHVHTGDTVATQEILGQVGFLPGTEGETNQPQLHFEVWHGDNVQRPEAKN